jgi:Alkylmercury lyase
VEQSAAGYGSGLEPRIRVSIYEGFVRDGRPPSITELGRVHGLDNAAVLTSLRHLADEKAIILTRDATRIIAAPPFSAIPTNFWVRTDRGAFWGFCAWEALGIAAELGLDADIDTTSGAGGAALRVEVRNGTVSSTGACMHIALPRRDWWNDVTYTCGTIMFFTSAAEVDQWSTDHGLPRGAVLDLEQAWSLAKDWFSGRRDPNWTRLPPKEAAASFARVNLQGDFWNP